MIVGVDEARNDETPAQLADRRARGHVDAAARPERNDTVVDDQQVRVVDHAVGLHRDHRRTAQQHGASWRIPRHLDVRHECLDARTLAGHAGRRDTRIERDRAQRPPVKRRADGPRDLRAIARPFEEIGTDIRDPPVSRRRRAEIDRGTLPARVWQRDEMQLLGSLREQPAAVGTQAQVVGR